MKKYMIFLLLMCFVSCNNNGEDPIPQKPLIINKSDSIAIWNIYNSIQQPSSYNWKPNDRKTLRGVKFLLDSVNNELRVVSLDIIGVKTELPQDYTKLPYLLQLTIWGLDISGTIAQDFNNLEYIESIRISTTSLGKTFPNSIFDLRNLKSLVVFGNKNLAGELPEDITDFVITCMRNGAEKYRLDFRFNSLTGRVPAAKVDYYYYDFGEKFILNNFTDVPKNYWSDPSIWFVDFNGNRISGRVPDTTLDNPRWKDKLERGGFQYQQAGYGLENYPPKASPASIVSSALQRADLESLAPSEISAPRIIGTIDTKTGKYSLY